MYYIYIYTFVCVHVYMYIPLNYTPQCISKLIIFPSRLKKKETDDNI